MHKDVDLGWYHLPAGSLGGCAFQYVGEVDGIPRVELHLEWQITPHNDPHWNIQGCYITKIQGDPCIYSKHLILPKPGTDFSSVEAFAAIGMTVPVCRAQLHSRGGRCTGRHRHQRRPAAARLRRPIRTLTKPAFPHLLAPGRIGAMSCATGW